MIGNVKYKKRERTRKWVKEDKEQGVGGRHVAVLNMLVRVSLILRKKWKE